MNTKSDFAVTGLISRGGLSNWVFFFLTDELVMIDVGMKPAIIAGLKAGILGQLGGVGYGVLNTMKEGFQADARQALIDWKAALETKAKTVLAMPSSQIRRIRLNLSMLGHELHLTGPNGDLTKFGLMNRKQALAAIEPLSQHYENRFETSKSASYHFFERHAPFLL
jgi:hypothetical protein